MPGIARVGDSIDGGIHCHGCDDGPRPTPGTILRGASHVYIEGRLAARAGDLGHTTLCCAKIGTIVLSSAQSKVFVEGVPVAYVGAPTSHCGSPGLVSSGSKKVMIAVSEVDANPPADRPAAEAQPHPPAPATPGKMP